MKVLREIRGGIERNLMRSVISDLFTEVSIVAIRLMYLGIKLKFLKPTNHFWDYAFSEKQRKNY